MKVAFIGAKSVDVVEKAINAWLAQRPNILIHFVTQSQGSSKPNQVGYIVVAIWYTEGKQ
jgi:hypothetical protein